VLLRRTVLVSGLFSQLAFGSEAENAFRKLEDSTEVRLQAAYSSEAIRITDPASVRELAEEVSRLRKKQWEEETVIKHGGCMYQVSFLADRQVLLHLYVYSEQVHRHIDKDAKSKHARAALLPEELPKLKARLGQLKLGARCKNAA
jgi:hypothetical protein